MNRLILPVTMTAFAALASAQTTTPVTCTAATLTGTRSLVLTGRTVTSAGLYTASYYGIGTATFDGVSKVTFNVTASSNSSQNIPQTLSGTYTIPTNCAGTISITSGDTATFTLIPYNTGKNFTLTGQNATLSFTGSGSMQPTACVTATLSGAYTFSGNGFITSGSTIGGVNTLSGILNFDGAGAISGSWTVAANGVLTPVSVTGTYSVSSCVATASLTDANGTAYTMSFTITSADGANFSMVGTSSGKLFSVTGHNTYTNPGLAVGNSAGVSGGTPPGSLFSIYGYNLATGQSQPTSFPLPTSAATASVTINGEAVPLTYVDKGQINAQLPLDIKPGVATLVVKTGSTLSNAVAIAVPATQPGVYVYGSNHAVAQNFPTYALNDESTQAAVGDTVIVYFTGGGAVQGGSVLVTGHATPMAQFPIVGTVTATIGGSPATVSFAGLTPGYAGLYQANVVVPNVPSGDRPLVLTVNGVASNSSSISVK